MSSELDRLREAARLAIREALTGCPPVPGDLRAALTLGIRFVDDQRIFELYVPGERPEDAVVLARATLDRTTGTGPVEVFPEHWTDEPDDDRT